jgi:aldose sugar dehydrogenase
MNRRAKFLAVILTLAVGVMLSNRLAYSELPAALTKAPAPAAKSAVKVEIVASDLAHPWALQFLRDGRMLVTERPGRLRVVSKDGKVSAPIEGMPKVAAVGQGGLLDLALHPKFADNQLVYFTFSEPRGGDSNGTSVARARLELDDKGGRLQDLRIIFRQEPAVSGGLHFGSRLAFADDGTLFVTLGERNQRDFAQDLSNHLGKVVRITSDDQFPADNPVLGPKAAAGIWSLGHRNVQSAAIHPTTRKLWTVEHGPKGGDEINIPEKGRNYGWPVIGYGIDYNGAKIHASTHKQGMEQPVYVWRPSIAPSGMAFYTGNRFPAWTGNLFVGALAGQHLARLVLDGDKVIAEERLLGDLDERIRDVRQGPDGFLYVLTDNPRGRLLRIVPAS